MDMYTLKWTRLQAEIFRLFCVKAGQKLNLRETARALKVTPTAVSKALLSLEKENLIKIQKSKTINLLSIEFNRDNQRAIELKRVENLKMIYESGLSDFLFNEFPGTTVFLFGSYSRGEDTWVNAENRSDIDIAVIGTKHRGIDLTKFNMILERDVIINYYTSWTDIHKHLRNNILNGIVLKGSVEI